MFRLLARSLLLCGARLGIARGVGQRLQRAFRRVAGRDQVYLPVRPNESKGWVNERDVVLASNPYSLQVRLHAHELVLRKRARVVARIRAAVGRSVLPTPTGLYYIVELLRQPNPKGPYGPYAFGLSAHSNVLYSFGGGPGQIGIHGTDVASSIGRSASHGGKNPDTT